MVRMSWKTWWVPLCLLTAGVISAMTGNGLPLLPTLLGFVAGIVLTLGVLDP